MSRSRSKERRISTDKHTDIHKVIHNVDIPTNKHATTDRRTNKQHIAECNQTDKYVTVKHQADKQNRYAHNFIQMNKQRYARVQWPEDRQLTQQDTLIQTGSPAQQRVVTHNRTQNTHVTPIVGCHT